MTARDVAMIDIRYSRCDRHGHLSVKRLLARYDADASIRDIMHEQIGSCPHQQECRLTYSYYIFIGAILDIGGGNTPTGAYGYSY